MSQPKPLPVLPLADLVLPERTRFFSTHHDQALSGELADAVARMIEAEGWAFSCGDTPDEEEIVLSTSEVASADGMLPLVVREAAHLMRLAMGAGPELRWASVPGSLCVFQPADQQENSASLAIWSLFCHYALETLVGATPEAALEGAPASLTRWRQAFLADIDRGELRPVATPTQRPAVRSTSDL